MNYTELTSSYFPARKLKLVPEIRVMSLVRGISYPVPVTNDNMPHSLPYWHSQAIARFVLDNPSLFSNRSVLDIGCGCGAASIAVAMAGGVALALDPSLTCLDFTEKNAIINGVTVDLIWGDHKLNVPADIEIVAGLFHYDFKDEIISRVRRVPSVIAVSACDLWDMVGFDEVAVHCNQFSTIHVFTSKHLV